MNLEIKLVIILDHTFNIFIPRNLNGIINQMEAILTTILLVLSSNTVLYCIARKISANTQAIVALELLAAAAFIWREGLCQMN